MEKRISVHIKGVKDGLLATMGEGEWVEVQDALLNYIQERASFFKGGRLALDVGNHVLHAAELGNLRDRLSEMGISLWAILSTSPTTDQTAQMLGLDTRLFAPRVERGVNFASKIYPDGEPAILVQRTMRWGTRVTYQGNVIIVGDVHPGAEIIASGSVIVWGRLRGTVHAGAEGNQNAIVCALELRPLQLRIASAISTAPEHRGKPHPQMARIYQGEVVADSWDYPSLSTASHHRTV